MFKMVDVARKAVGAVAGVAAKVAVVESKFQLNSRLNGPWPLGPFLWLHGASLGECRMLLNLAEFIQQDIPGCPKLLMTTQKVEVLEFLNKKIEEEQREGIEAALAPADVPSALHLFAKVVKPVGLVLGENELWPGYLSLMQKLCVRPSVALVSGRYYASVPGVSFSALGFVGMQTGSDLSRFMNVASRANISRIRIGGDWKLLKWARSGEGVKCCENPTIDATFVSFHWSEWSRLERMVDISMCKQWAVVLAPRRLGELERFTKALLSKKVEVVQWPQVKKGAVSVVEEFGQMGKIFEKSRLAVVGGSFERGLGVHDFWEPMQKGAAVCVGPYVAGQKETVSALVREGALVQLSSAGAFANFEAPHKERTQKFLNQEREKILDSYEELLAFLKTIL
ncbi:MAG: 3-deoxy-D-manno-octulosonic acid transferase [Fibrobacteraceae bacterium]|nr:3-deoxy-D-manno-octulosonic acid transferase [Fibrobacteraceae bacterium]